MNTFLWGIRKPMASPGYKGPPPRTRFGWGGSRGLADDIAIRNVTHINRVPVAVCEMAVEFAARAGGPAPGEAPG